VNPAQAKLEAAIIAVHQERARHDAGIASVGTPEQLSHVERELTQMLDDVIQGQCQPQRVGLGRAVVDSWPLQHELTDQVCKAVNAYCALERASQPP
jgi:hypothetical protein